jgi:transcriptional regulator with XRE-family HTH domain
VLGVRQSCIAQIESARANLKIDTLDRLAAVFGVEPARLLQVGQLALAPRPEPVAAD